MIDRLQKSPKNGRIRSCTAEMNFCTIQAAEQFIYNTIRNKEGKMKRVILKATGILVLAAMLTGCGTTAATDTAATSAAAAENATSAVAAATSQAAEAASTAEAAKKSNVTITFGTHQSGLPTSGVVQDLAADFEKETGIKVDFQVTPDDQWRDLLKTKLDSGEAYDIMCVDADPLSLVSRINPEQNCVDLSDQEWVSRMDPLVLPDVTVNGKVYGVQFPGTRISACVYNKDIYQKLGLSVPKTYKDFKANCQKILDSGITPMYEGCQNGWHQVLPVFETGSYYSLLYDNLYEKLNKNEMHITDIKEMKEILEEMKECADAGYFGQDFLSQTVEGGVDAFGTGEAAMMYQSMDFIDQVEEAYPDMKGKMGIFCLPWADNQSVSVNPTNNAYFINKNSKYIDECKQFLNFLARPENLQKRLDGGGITSVCWPEIPSKERPEVQEYMKSLPQGLVMQVGVSYIDPQWMDVGKDIDAMYSGTMTPDEVFQNIEKRRNEQAELQNDPAWAK